MNVLRLNNHADMWFGKVAAIAGVPVPPGRKTRTGTEESKLHERRLAGPPGSRPDRRVRFKGLRSVE